MPKKPVLVTLEEFQELKTQLEDLLPLLDLGDEAICDRIH